MRYEPNKYGKNLLLGLLALFVIVSCGKSASVTATPFGQLSTGEEVTLWHIENPSGASMDVTDFGRRRNTGRGVQTWTTEPTLLTYTGRGFSPENHPNGKYGPIDKFAGMLLETIHFPDSPNQDRFPSTVLRPGEKYHSVTQYRFYAK